MLSRKVDECKPLVHGDASAETPCLDPSELLIPVGIIRFAIPRRRQSFCHGEAVHVDPIKPKLKPPRTERLKLTCDHPLSNLSFNFNLRRYTVWLDGDLHHGTSGRGSHSSTAQLNLCRFCHRNSMIPPSVPLKSAHDEPKSGRV